MLAVACAQAPAPAAPAPTGELSQNTEGFTDISAEQLATLLENKDFTLVNVHIPYEGDIPGTDLSIPFNDIAERVAELPQQDARIVLYCRSGSMSTTAARTLVSLGYSNVMELDGGMRAWDADGYEIEGH